MDDKDQDKGMDEVMEEIADDLGYKERGEIIRRRKVSPDSGSRKYILLLGVAAILILILLILLFFRGGDRLSAQDLKAIRASISQIDERLRRIERLEDRINLLEKQDRELQQSVLETDRSGRSLSAQLTRLSQEIAQLQERMPSGRKASSPAPKPPAPQGKERYHEVQQGDTLYGIAQKYGVSLDALLRANSMGPKDLLQPGQKIVIPSQ